jgi:hypothetical protein
MIINCFITNAIDVAIFGYKGFLRLQDRGLKDGIKENPDDDFCDEVNTLSFTQKELEDLYTGDAFNGQRKIARVISTVAILCIYTSGMPVMYLVGFVFTLLTFYTNKYLLVNFYRSSAQELDPNMVRNFVYQIRYIIFLKLLMGLFSFCNPRIFAVRTDAAIEDSSLLLFRYDFKALLYERGLDWAGDAYEAFESGGGVSFDYFHEQAYLLFTVAIIGSYIAYEVVRFVAQLSMALAGGIITSCFEGASQAGVYTDFLT